MRHPRPGGHPCVPTLFLLLSLFFWETPALFIWRPVASGRFASFSFLPSPWGVLCIPAPLVASVAHRVWILICCFGFPSASSESACPHSCRHALLNLHGSLNLMFYEIFSYCHKCSSADVSSKSLGYYSHSSQPRDFIVRHTLKHFLCF